jgi:hypothetical protein
MSWPGGLVRRTRNAKATGDKKYDLQHLEEARRQRGGLLGRAMTSVHQKPGEQ